MRWGWVVMVGVLAVGAVGCGTLRSPAPPPPPPVVGGVQVGIASWYGPGFHGNRTANGEIYDQYELTAAHPTLPLGTRVMVTSLANGRSVEVRINDRGPFVDGRVIDLSYAAAHTLRMVGPGTARVRVDVLGRAPVQLVSRAPVPMVPLAAEPKARYRVEVASFGDRGKADHLRGVLATRFPEAYVDPLDTGTLRYYRVRIGPYPDRAAALARAERVSRLGYPAILVEEARP